ncbi:MAG: maleate cis-trans isomerase family protein [Granulosicoccaceae bacterium]
MTSPPIQPDNCVQNWKEPQRAHLGFVVAAEDHTFESDVRSVQAAGIELSFARMAPAFHYQSATRTQPDLALQQIRRASRALYETGDLDVAIFAMGRLCALLGNHQILETVYQGAPGALVSSIHSATKRAFRAIQVKRVVVATGYGREINSAIANAMGHYGYKVVNIRGMCSSSHRDFSLIEPRKIREFVLSLDRADADAIVISSTSMRAMEVVEELEQIAGKPVLCSNQMVLWDALRSAGINDRISGYGNLLREF